AAISLAAAGVMIWSVMPGRVLVSPADWARKWSRGRIELVPFTRPDASLGESLYQWGASICIAIPLGMWAFHFLYFVARRRPTLASQALLAISLGLLPELLQVPIDARVASATDALFGIVGAAVGLTLARWVWGT